MVSQDIVDRVIQEVENEYLREGTGTDKDSIMGTLHSHIVNKLFEEPDVSKNYNGYIVSVDARENKIRIYYNNDIICNVSYTMSGVTSERYKDAACDLFYKITKLIGQINNNAKIFKQINVKVGTLYHVKHKFNSDIQNEIDNYFTGLKYAPESYSDEDDDDDDDTRSTSGSTQQNIPVAPAQAPAQANGTNTRFSTRKSTNTNTNFSTSRIGNGTNTRFIN